MRQPHRSPTAIVSTDVYAPLLDRLSRVIDEQPGCSGAWAALVGVAEAMVQLASAGAPREGAVRQLLERAVDHGQHRRAEGADADIVLDDYELLRGVLWGVLRELPTGMDDHMEALGRFDVYSTLALRASMLGHGRVVLERAERWQRAWDALLGEAGLTPA